MEKINVAIADDDIEADDLLSRMVIEDESLRLVGKAHSEEEFVQMIQKYNLDIVIFDSIIPKLRKTNRRIAIAPAKHNMEVKYKIQDSRLKLREGDETKMEAYVTELFRVLDIPMHVRGYHYLRDAVLLSAYDRDMLGSVTKLLYPKIAGKYGTTPARVERAIRHAIELSWSRGENGKMTELFGYTPSAGKGKPTNTEFISIVSDHVRLEWEKMYTKGEASALEIKRFDKIE